MEPVLARVRLVNIQGSLATCNPVAPAQHLLVRSITVWSAETA